MINFLAHKWTHIFILFMLLFAAVFFSASENDLRNRFQYFIFDNYNKIYPRAATDEVMIVDIDENSLREMGQWPWPRDIMAKLVDNLDAMGAKVIAFDIVFAEEDRTSPRHIIERLPSDETFQATRNQIQELDDHDDVFSKSIAQSGKVVTGFTSAGTNETRRVPFQPVAPTFLTKNKDNIINRAHQARGVATNLKKFSNQAAGNGHFMVSPETDGLIRKVSLFSHYTALHDRLYPLLSLEALRVSHDPKSRILVKGATEKSIFDLDYQLKVGEYSVPMDVDTRFWMHYRDVDKASEYVPALSILNEDAGTADKIKDKIILVGTSAEGLRDIRSTPLKRFVPGVEVHVNLIEQIIQGRFLKRPNFFIGLEALALLALGGGIILLAPFIRLIWLGGLTVIIIGGMFAASWVGYKSEGLLLDPVYPSLVLFLLFITSSLLSYMRSELDRRHIKAAFGHYISPVFMEELTNNPEKLKLGGEVRELSVMFTDIRNFTAISETLSPEELIKLMNDFLTPMSDIVMESRGTIDKYMGDAMMAFWNAPLDDPNHVRQACRAALQMNDALADLNARGGADAMPLSAGIGINTGACSVGNMGSKQRFAYSALGDAVNLASRLEGQTKYYGVDILMGEDTYRHVTNMACLELDLIQVVGRDKAVKIYTLLGDADLAQDAEFKKWQAAHNGMLAAYRAADFSCAAQDCTESSKLAKGQLSTYYGLYKKRIIEYTKNPPPEEWSGVYVSQNK